jgi:hypothetical protein
MARSWRPNRLDVVAAVAVIATSWLFMRYAWFAADLYFNSTFHPLSGAMQALGVVGWLLATFGPVGVAVIFWRLAKRGRKWLLLHVFFLPCAIALFVTGQRIMLLVIGDPDFDATLGGPVLQAFALFVFSVAAYFAALAWKGISDAFREA